MAAAGIEIALPDLPEVAMRLGPDQRPPDAPERRRRRRPLMERLRDGLTAYLPLLLMVALALGTWWLVKNSPQPLAAKPDRASTGEPDYTLQGFTMQRFAPDGALQLTLVGRQLHHFPDTDRVEIEELHLTVEHAAQGRTVATARKALTDGKATQVDLLGGAQVRGRTADGQPMEIDSEFLRVESTPLRVSTPRAVELRVGASVVRAGGLRWDQTTRELELLPPVRAVLQPRSGDTR